MADKAAVWAKRYLRELAKHPVNGELSIGDILHRYYKYHGTIRSVGKAAQIDSNLMIDSGRTIRRISIRENQDQYRQTSRSKKFKKKAREVSAILEKSENILTRGKKRGRTYRHKNARPMLTDQAIAYLIPKLLEALGPRTEVRWMQIHPLVEAMVMEFHRSCEGDPDLWIDKLSNPLIFVVDQEDLQLSLVDGRRRLQFSFQTEGLTLDDIIPYKNEFHTKIEDWVPNTYTRTWFSKSSANIQRLLSQGGSVCEGSKRGYWIYRAHLPPRDLKSEASMIIETAVTHTHDGLWTIFSKQENMFNQFNMEFKRISEADRATVQRLYENQLKAQLNTLEKLSMKLSESDTTLVRARAKDEIIEAEMKRTEEFGSAIEAELKEWRLKRSRKIERPAYHVFSDATMRELARAMPRTVEQLLEVRGIGPAKVDEFGPELLQFLEAWRKSVDAAAM